MKRTLLFLTSVVMTACFQPAMETAAPVSSVDAGAGGGVGGGGEALPDGGAALYAAAKPDCAPDDGPAWKFLLSPTPVTCDDLAFESEGFYLWLWAGDVEVRNYSIGTTSPTEGAACLCGAIGDQATAGSVTIHTSTDAGIAGRLNATFSTGTERRDDFNAILCPGLRQCG
jgi:hypothetical protein